MKQINRILYTHAKLIIFFQIYAAYQATENAIIIRITIRQITIIIILHILSFYVNMIVFVI